MYHHDFAVVDFVVAAAAAAFVAADCANDDCELKVLRALAGIVVASGVLLVPAAAVAAVFVGREAFPVGS